MSLDRLESGEAELWRGLSQTGSATAREALFTLHNGFARQIARRHFLDRTTGDIEFQDLCQLASAGLLEAIDRFDPARGASFRDYAARRISGSIRDGIVHMSELREQMSFRSRVRNERVQSLAANDGEALSAADAMDALVELATGLALGFMLEGTHLVVGEGEIDRGASAYESLVWKDTVKRVMAEVSALSERERSIIWHHYLNGLDFDQVGRLLGISKGRVSQLHQAALGLLRKRLRRSGDFKLER